MANVQSVKASEATGKTVQEQLMARIAELEAANADLAAKKSAPAGLSLKVGEKGGISVYGMARFPITLYAEQFPRFFGLLPAISALILRGGDGERNLTFRTAEGKAAAQEWAKRHVPTEQPKA